MPATKKATRKPAKKPLRKTRATRRLSPAHKRALAEGRTMSATVDRYLAAVNTPKRRGRKVTKATLEQRLTHAQSRVKAATGVEKVIAAQEVRDLQKKLAQLRTTSSDDTK